MAARGGPHAGSELGCAVCGPLSCLSFPSGGPTVAGDFNFQYNFHRASPPQVLMEEQGLSQCGDLVVVVQAWGEGDTQAFKVRVTARIQQIRKSR